MGTAAHYKNDYCEIVFRPDYIVEITVFDMLYDKPQVEEIVKLMNEATHGMEYLVLIVAGKNSKITLRAAKFLSTSPALKYALAKAYVVKSRHQRIMASIFSTFFKPKESIRFFRTRLEAELWLKHLIEPAGI